MAGRNFLCLSIAIATTCAHGFGSVNTLSGNMPTCGLATQGCPDTDISKGCGGQGQQGGIPPNVPLCYGYGFDGCSYNKGAQGPDAHAPDCNSPDQLFNLVDEPSDYSQAARDWMAYADKHATPGSAFLKLVQSGRVTTPGTTGGDQSMRSNLEQFFSSCPGCKDPSSKYYTGTISFHAFANTNSGDKAPFTGNVAWIVNTAVSTLRQAFPGMKLAMTNYGVLGGGSTSADEVAFINTLFSQLSAANERKLDYVYYFAAKDYGGGATHNGLCEPGITQALAKGCGLGFAVNASLANSLVLV